VEFVSAIKLCGLFSRRLAAWRRGLIL